MPLLLLTLPSRLEDLWSIVKQITVVDVIDILCVSVLLYYLYRFIRDRRAGKLALGVLFLLAVKILSDVADMYLLQYILQNIFQIGFITLVILFQPEIRSVLEKVGATPIKANKSLGESRGAATVQHMIAIRRTTPSNQ